MALPTVYNQISANRHKTYFIMAAFAAFIVLLVYVFANALGYDQPSVLSLAGFALILAGVMNIGSFYFSDKIVMAISGAKQIQKADNPVLFNTVENLCIASGLPMPKVYILEDTAPNAFATGRDPKHAAICATTGILAKLDKLELEGVIAHELSHIGNRDTLVMTVVTVLVGMIALLADWFLRISFWRGRDDDRDRGNGAAIFMIIGLVFAILSPLIAQLIQLAVSRRREFLADASGALLTRHPEGLAQALLKIASDREPLEAANKATAHLYIVNPFKEGMSSARMKFANLFDTHPPIEERVAALRAMQTP